jgi:hypothetical protein
MVFEKLPKKISKINLMKKSVLSLLFAVVCFAASYAQTTSNIVIFSVDGDPFYVVINGIKQNLEPRTNVKITGLKSRSNQVRIMFKDERIPFIDKAVYFDTMGFESTMKITKTKKKGYKLRYFDHVEISKAPSYENQFVSPYSNGSTNTTTNTQTTTTTQTNPTQTTNTQVNQTHTHTHTDNHNHPHDHVHSNPTTTVTQTTTSTPTTTVTQTNSNQQVTQNAGGVSLNYNWKPGTAHQFSAEVIDNVSTSMMGMNINETFKTTTEFVLYINSVASNGYALGTLYLTNFKITDSKNTVLASLNDIPKSAIQSEVTVDRKGVFTFNKKVYLITTETGNVLAYGNASNTSVQAGGQAGNMKVDAYAEFNPKTGTLKTGYSVKEIKATKKVDVKVTEDTEMIDLFPYDFLELLAVPEGTMAVGDNMEVKAGMYKTNVLVKSLSNGIAQLNTKMSTDKSADMFGGGAKGNSGGSTIDMQMDGQGKVEGVEGMGDLDSMMNMDLTKEDKAAMDMAKGMSPDMSADINYNFNYTEGMFQNVSGTVNTVMNAMGMKMTVLSVLNMRKM